jgi:hypothetical protein
VTNNLVVTGPGIFINRPAASSGEPYLFWQKDGVNRGSIYGANNAEGLRYFGASHCFEGVVCTNQGVKFASGASALNYYETGTWSPTVDTFDSLPSTTYTDRQGTYTRIGNMVYAFFDFTTSSISGGSGGARISGLPFTVSNTQAGYSVAQWRDSGAIAAGAANTVLKGFVNKGTTYIYIQIDNTGSAGFGNSSGANWNSSGRSTGFVIYQA